MHGMQMTLTTCIHLWAETWKDPTGEVQFSVQRRGLDAMIPVDPDQLSPFSYNGATDGAAIVRSTQKRQITAEQLRAQPENTNLAGPHAHLE